jgi:hypothetical protein
MGGRVASRAGFMKKTSSSRMAPVKAAPSTIRMMWTLAMEWPLRI